MQVVKKFCAGCKKEFEEFEKVKLSTDNLDLLKPKKMTSLQLHALANRLTANISSVMDDALMAISDDEYVELLGIMKEEILTILQNE